MLVDRLLTVSAQRSPGATALLEPGRRISYSDLDRLVNQIASMLRYRAVRRGDRVVIAGRNSIELAACYLGVMRAGAVAVPLASGVRNDRLPRVLVDCQPVLCFVDAATAADAGCRMALSSVSQVILHEGGTVETSYPTLTETLSSEEGTLEPARSIDLDLAAIMYTSGSTGEPRGVMLTHRNVVANTRSIVEYLRLTCADRVMCVLPFSYVYGLSLLHTHLAVGGSLLVHNRFAYADAVMDSMREYAVTGFAGVPSTFAILLNALQRRVEPLPESLRYATQAGGPMPTSTIREWCRRVPKVPLYIMYGATEAAARLTYLEPEALPRKAGSIGRPIPNVEVTVLTEGGNHASVGEIGELVANGSNISPGYWNASHETALRFTREGYRTGDLGYADEDGYLFLVGRRFEVIKVGAHRVGPKEIEDVLAEHPSVREVAVVGCPHDVLGEVPVAFVVLDESTDVSDGELARFCATRLPKHKVPGRIIRLSRLPTIGEIGKTDRVKLRTLCGGSDSDSVRES